MGVLCFHNIRIHNISKILFNYVHELIIIQRIIEKKGSTSIFKENVAIIN